jgi:hypothetical protein
MKQIEKSNRKRLNNVPHFLHACTLLMYEIHALKKGGTLFKRLR